MKSNLTLWFLFFLLSACTLDYPVISERTICYGKVRYVLIQSSKNSFPYELRPLFNSEGEKVSCEGE